jgi:transposase
LIPRGERRRRWTTEQKQTIAAQSLAPGASPANIARLHGISTGQLYTWRHALRAAQPDAAFGRFARVEVAPQPVARVDIPARPARPAKESSGVYFLSRASITPKTSFSISSRSCSSV